MVSLSSRRPIRESPRLLGAGILVAICLLLVGVLIGSAISGSSGQVRTARASASSGSVARSASVSQLHRTVAAQAASLHSDRARLSALRSKLIAVQHQSARKTLALRRSRRAARCWRARAKHPGDSKLTACLTS